MNFIEKRKMEAFLKGKKVEALEKSVDLANDINLTFTNISLSLANIVGQID
jgi:hypothetical protein